jgi:hypothetical protein
VLNADKAREMQLIGAKFRTLKHQAKILAQAELMKPQPDKDYQQLRLMRVRMQLDRLDAWLLKETDPAKCDRIAAAQARVYEQERQLSGRSLPPTQKPSAPAKSRSQASEPTPLEE